MKSSGKIKRIIAGLLVRLVLGLSAAAQTGGSDGRADQTMGSGGYTGGSPTGQILGNGGRAGDGGLIGSGTLAATADGGGFYEFIQNWLETGF